MGCSLGVFPVYFDIPVLIVIIYTLCGQSYCWDFMSVTSLTYLKDTISWKNTFFWFMQAFISLFHNAPRVLVKGLCCRYIIQCLIFQSQLFSACWPVVFLLHSLPDFEITLFWCVVQMYLHVGIEISIQNVVGNYARLGKCQWFFPLFPQVVTLFPLIDHLKSNQTTVFVFIFLRYGFSV